MNCKRCNAELPENSRFCPACGAVQPTVCPACGAESRPGSKTCSGCGKKLPVVHSGSIEFYKKKKTPMELTATILLIVGAVLVLTAAGLFLAGVISDVSTPKEQPVQEELSQPPVIDLDEEPLEIEPVEKTPVEEEATEQTPVEEDPVEEEPVEEDPPAEETAAQNDQLYFPDSAERLLTDADVEGLSKAELQIARNEIYARHGRRFKNADLQKWFDSCDWYSGTISPDQFDEGVLNQTERANVDFLKEKENG